MTDYLSFNKLPFELQSDITGYLDKDAAKSLRLACPTPKVLAITGPIVFETLVVRLGNHRDSQAILDNLRHCLLNANNNIDFESNGILKYVRRLVVDTRYPFVVDDDFIATRPEWHAKQVDKADDYATVVSDEYIDSFMEVLKLIFSTISGRLKSLKWQTSDFPNFDLHGKLAQLLCIPATEREYELTVSCSFGYTCTLLQYLEPISGCDHFQIAGHHIASCVDWDSTNIIGLTTLLQRCKRLKSFYFISEVWIDDEALDVLWKEINEVEMLEEVKVQTRETIMGSVEPNIKPGRLKALSLGCSEDLIYHLALDPCAGFYDNLTAAGIRGITKITTLKHTPSFERLVLQQHAITDLTLHMKSLEDFLSIWGIIVPAVSKTLRRFRLTGRFGERSSEWSQTTSPPSALLKCKSLEEVEVPFIERDFRGPGPSVINGLPNLIRDFVRHCPKLTTIYTGDIGADHNVLYSLLNELRDFKSIDQIFRCRDLQIVLKRDAISEWGRVRSKTRVPRVGGEEDMVGVFDYYIHRWRLVEMAEDEEKVYKFQRMVDKCWMLNECWEDD
ncbi:hypothetical protein TWF730_005092 [Orbilia blumenaviensis]|uniref:F-box domain-containing protein n=1 Tax=Orbilia blumenaviensis TaxID=1796055 RepID=A0AAV9VIE4_9PEZI